MYAFVLAAILAAGVAPPDGAKLFNDNCTACHTIGGGDGAGPDLIHAAAMPRDGIRKAVTRMQDNVGPLQPDQIDALVAFLQSKAPAPAVAMSPEQKAAKAAIGRQLFFGERRLANGGTPCFACHAVAGRGGNLAVDLTGVYARRGEAALISTEEQPAVPLMKAAYAAHALTPQEAWHLAAFFKDAPNEKPAIDRTVLVHGSAAGIAAVVLAAIAVVIRPRRRRNP